MIVKKIEDYIARAGRGGGEKLSADFAGLMYAIGVLADALSEKRSGMGFLGYLTGDNAHQVAGDLTEYGRSQCGGGFGAAAAQVGGDDYAGVSVVIYAPEGGVERYLHLRPGDAVGVTAEGRVVHFREQAESFNPAAFHPAMGQLCYEVVLRNPQSADGGGRELSVTFEDSQRDERGFAVHPGGELRQVIAYSDKLQTIRIDPLESGS